MINPVFITQLSAANRYLQQFISEMVTIAQVNYTCSEGESFKADLDYETGGATQVQRGSVLVNKQDLANPPIRGTIVSFRGLGFRVVDVDDLVATWDIHLIQLSA